MKLCVFLHGTAIMHASGVGVSRAEWVRQVRERDPTVRDFASYVPAEDVLPKLRSWQAQGAEIVYLSSHRATEDVAADRSVLEHHGFPAGPVLFRGDGESYGDVVAREAPDLLIEDDCESVGAEQIAYLQVPGPARASITSIVVPEFAGFADLPDSLDELAGGAATPSARG